MILNAIKTFLYLMTPCQLLTLCNTIRNDRKIMYGEFGRSERQSSWPILRKCLVICMMILYKTWKLPAKMTILPQFNLILGPTEWKTFTWTMDQKSLLFKSHTYFPFKDFWSSIYFCCITCVIRVTPDSRGQKGRQTSCVKTTWHNHMRFWWHTSASTAMTLLVLFLQFGL